MSTTASERSFAMEMDVRDGKAFTRVPTSVLSNQLSVRKHNLTDTSSDTVSTPLQKSVTFADESGNQEITPSGHLTEEDRAAMYMSDADQRRIFLDISKTLRRARAIQRDDSTNHPETTGISLMEIDEGIRGLESVIQRKSNRSVRMRAAIVAVLDRQLTHPIDESWLNGFYRPLVRESKSLARNRAVRDEVEANNLHITTTHSCTSISTTSKRRHEGRGTKRTSAMVRSRSTRKRRR
jgi:hypothetical protein